MKSYYCSIICFCVCMLTIELWGSHLSPEWITASGNLLQTPAAAWPDTLSCYSQMHVASLPRCFLMLFALMLAYFQLRATVSGVAVCVCLPSEPIFHVMGAYSCWQVGPLYPMSPKWGLSTERLRLIRIGLSDPAPLAYQTGSTCQLQEFIIP